MKQISRTVAGVLTFIAVATNAPLASAAEVNSGGIAVTPYAAGMVGDMFECGGALGRMWCK